MKEGHRSLCIVFSSQAINPHQYGEVAALRRIDIHLPYVHVRKNISAHGVVDAPKTASGIRKIVLPRTAQVVISEQLKSHDGERVWCTEDGKLYTSNRVIAETVWYRLLDRAGIKRRLTPYKTRHSFIS